MLIYCCKCFTPHRFDNDIPKAGKRLQCNECGYKYTLFPSKVIIGEFRDYVMDGRPPQTYEQIGLEHDISRERVRGIVEKLKHTGQLPVYRLRLDPLIERAEKIVLSMGRKMTISDLNTHLLCFGSQGELLKYATPFIKYLNGFPLWQKAGLSIRDDLIFIESDLNA